MGKNDFLQKTDNLAQFKNDVKNIMKIVLAPLKIALHMMNFFISSRFKKV